MDPVISLKRFIKTMDKLSTRALVMTEKTESKMDEDTSITGVFARLVCANSPETRTRVNGMLHSTSMCMTNRLEVTKLVCALMNESVNI